MTRAIRYDFLLTQSLICFEIENFQLLTMIFSENFLSMESFLEWCELVLILPDQKGVAEVVPDGHFSR
jgi:hypothetical protein